MSIGEKMVSILSPRNKSGPSNTEYDLKQFYRSKDSPAEIRIGSQPDLLEKADT